jgi:uncharacterized protein with ParB-like and HNH nuclease domain
MRRTVIAELYDSTIFFSHYLTNGMIYGKKVIEYKGVFRFYLQIFSETFLILGRTERHIIKNMYLSSCKVPVVLCRI